MVRVTAVVTVKATGVPATVSISASTVGPLGAVPLPPISPEVTRNQLLGSAKLPDGVPMNQIYVVATARYSSATRHS
jgi:hypothetical protein